MIEIEFNPGTAPRLEQTSPGTTIREALGSEESLAGLCGGRGMCGRCRCHVDESEGLVAPMNERERRTLDLLPDTEADHRLACQTRLLAGRVRVATEDAPRNLSVEDLDDYVGRRAAAEIRHPETGERLVRAGQVMLRMQIMKLAGSSARPQVLEAALGAG